MSFFILGFLKTLGHCLAFLPRKIQLFIGSIIGYLWFDVFQIRRKVILENLKLAYPEKTNQERINIGRFSIVNLGQTIVEYLLMLVYKEKWTSQLFQYKGFEHLENARKKGKGVFLLTLHMGNGDMAALGLNRKGYSTNMISKRAKQKWLNDIWFSLREKLGTHIIAHEKSHFEILKILKKQENIIWVLDQFMGPPSGVKTTFFGRQTGTALGLALFAERTGVPVLPAYSYRDDDGRFVCVVEPEVPFEYKDSRDETIQHMTQLYTDKLERIVRFKPEQWMWVHRRWKKFG